MKVPVIIQNKIGNVGMIDIHIHIDERRFKSNRNIEYPRIPQERATIRINNIDFTVVLDKCSRFAKASKQPGTFRRD